MHEEEEGGGEGEQDQMLDENTTICTNQETAY